MKVGGTNEQKGGDGARAELSVLNISRLARVAFQCLADSLRVQYTFNILQILVCLAVVALGSLATAQKDSCCPPQSAPRTLSPRLLLPYFARF